MMQKNDMIQSEFNELQLAQREKSLSGLRKELVGLCELDREDKYIAILDLLDEAYAAGYADAQNETKESLKLDY